MAVADLYPAPVLAGTAPPRRRSFLERRRIARRNPFEALPPAAYEEAVHVMKGPFGAAYLVNDPVGVKQVMLDKVANYPKTEMERKFFSLLFGNGLLSSDGETWRSHRRAMAPSFDPRSVAAYAPAMARAAESFRRRWDALPAGSVVDVAEDMKLLTLQIISETMFSADSADLIDLVDAALKGGTTALDFNILFILPIIGPMMIRRRQREIAEVFAPMDAVVARLVAERKADPDGGPLDLLGRLIAAEDERGGCLTAQEVRDQVVTIFFAGHETTAQAMTWIWYLLSQHPAQEARLHAELDAVLGGRPPTHEDVGKLNYTRMVIDEAMRIYPPAPGLSMRQALEDDVVCGVRIPKGATVAVSPWVIHRHRDLWPEPERFDPERFSPERSKDRPRFAYMPFGAGPRVCIGMALAQTEAILILAALAQHYSPRLVPGHPVEPMHRVTLRSKHGMRMVLERRRTGA